MIPLQMELGGKDACIVLEDADLELAATNIIKGGYSYRFLYPSQAFRGEVKGCRINAHSIYLYFGHMISNT